MNVVETLNIPTKSVKEVLMLECGAYLVVRGRCVVSV